MIPLYISKYRSSSCKNK